MRGLVFGAEKEGFFARWLLVLSDLGIVRLVAKRLRTVTSLSYSKHGYQNSIRQVTRVRQSRKRKLNGTGQKAK
jgi:hypothetical protein